MVSEQVGRLAGGVNVIGYFRGQFGLGETSRLLVATLEKLSIPFALISADSLAGHHSKTGEYSHAFVQKPKYDINLFCIGNDDIGFFLRKIGADIIKDRYNIRLFFWEADVVPKGMLRMLSCFDEIWVTTRYNHASLALALSIPVRIIPQPLQLEYNYSENIPTKASFGLDDKYTFLFSFDFHGVFQRKNPLALVKAFQTAFPHKDDVQLVIKSHNGHHYKDLLNLALREIRDDHRMHWIDQSMSPHRRYDLINACDCYVSLHRSEGFGLSLAEAMLMEKPVIATGFSGNLDFMTPQNSFLCKYAMAPIGPGNYPYPAEGVWANVDIDDAAHWMRYVVDNKPEAKSRGVLARQDMVRNHSFDAVGKAVAESFQEISARWNGRGDLVKHCQFLAYAALSVVGYYYKRLGWHVRRILKKVGV